MQDDFASVFKLAIRQAFRSETLALALVQILLLALLTVFAQASFDNRISLTGRAALDLLFAWLLTGFGLVIFGVLLMSRLNGKVFGRPFPVGTLQAAWRYIKALLTLMLMALAIVLPVFISVQVISKLTTGAMSQISISLLPATFALVLLYLMLVRYQSLPIMTIYEGELSFRRSRALLNGRRCRASGVVLAITLVFVGADMLASWAVRDIVPLESALANTFPFVALAYGPLTVAASVFYLTGATSIDGRVL